MCNSSRSPDTELHNHFALEDCLQFITSGVGALANDQFTECFQPKRNISLDFKQYFQIPYRYLCLFPLRLCILLMGTFIFFCFLPLAHLHSSIRDLLFLFYNWIFIMALGGKIRYHGIKPKLNEPHLFVSNHTSFIDYFVLSAHQFAHATVAQQHGGVMGWLQTYVLSLNGSLMFQRSQKSDRESIARNMEKHIFQNPDKNPPLLIFPEGTCVNNEYTVLFHKGAFSMNATVCPVAIKYDKSFGDPYWQSSCQSFFDHLFYLMTCPALVADVWWLPEQRLLPGEDSTHFANRVKEMISKRAGLTCLHWDGYLKNFFTMEKKSRLLAGQQSNYARSIRAKLRKSQPDETKELNFPLHLSQQEVFELKNKLIIKESNDGLVGWDLIQLHQQQEDIIRTWKKFTKIKEVETTDEANARRMENSSWRQWFRQQNRSRKALRQSPEYQQLISSF